MDGISGYRWVFSLRRVGHRSAFVLIRNAGFCAAIPSQFQATVGMIPETGWDQDGIKAAKSFRFWDHSKKRIIFPDPRELKR
jgi:hypothetical protein